MDHCEEIRFADLDLPTPSLARLFGREVASESVTFTVLSPRSTAPRIAKVARACGFTIFVTFDSGSSNFVLLTLRGAQVHERPLNTALRRLGFNAGLGPIDHCPQAFNAASAP